MRRKGEALLGAVGTLDAELGCDFFSPVQEASQRTFQVLSSGLRWGRILHTVYELRQLGRAGVCNLHRLSLRLGDLARVG